MTIGQKLAKPFITSAVLAWDFGLFFLNLVLPSHKSGEIVPAGAPGHKKHWPEYMAPQEGDSRSACPMLNALANHGILPRDGKDIRFRDLSAKVHQTFNFSPSFCFFASKVPAEFLGRSYWNDSFNLEELSKHNAIEHDASLTRHDSALVPDQGKPDLQLVDEFLGAATGKLEDGTAVLTKKDMSLALAKRRAAAKQTNDDYTESMFHNMFGSANSCTMLTIFGGRVDDLRPMLTDERFPDDWEPRNSSRYGLTMASFNATVLSVEMGIKEKKAE